MILHRKESKSSASIPLSKNQMIPHIRVVRNEKMLYAFLWKSVQCSTSKLSIIAVVYYAALGGKLSCLWMKL